MFGQQGAESPTPAKSWTIDLAAGQTTGSTPEGDEYVITAWNRSVTFTEKLIDAEGKVISASPCGLPNETIPGNPEPEFPIDISTTIQHDGNPTTGPVVGDNIWDKITNTAPGGAIAGDTTVVKLYRHTNPAKPVCDASELVWTSGQITWTEGQTETVTPDKYKTTQSGTYVMVETTTRNGQVASVGDCNDKAETITVKTPTKPSSALAHTGASDATPALIGGATALLVMGALGVVLAKRRRATSVPTTTQD